MITFLFLIILSCTARAQQVYVSRQGPVPVCSRNNAEEGKYYAQATPAASFSKFSFTQTATVRTATSVLPGATTTYAPPYSALQSLLPALSTTTWGNWDPNATNSAGDTEDPYGQAAWSSLWERTSLQNWTTRGLYSTTVVPTPVPTTELILPPPLYFGPVDCYRFPDGFIFGVASSAGQMEGAIADEGRAPSLMELPIGLGQGTETNFVANEFYYMYKQDIERMASMGVEYFSFSISWSRVIPFASPGSPVNQQALAHYNDLVDFILEKGMKPVVTLYHFDTPLQFYANLSQRYDSHFGYLNGGYDNTTFADAFVYYGKVVMAHLADRVPLWITWNEPLLFTSNGQSIDTVLKSHARLYHFYKDEINGRGKVSLKLSVTMGMPQDPLNSSHVNAANHYNDLQAATFAAPLMLGIDYPEAYKKTVTDYIPLTTEDLQYLGGTADFFALDAYTSVVVTPPSTGTIDSCAANVSDPLYPWCVEQSVVDAHGWNIGYRSQSYVYTTPLFLRALLNYVWNSFRKPVIITEIGFPVFGESQKDLADQLYDTPRSEYYLSFLSETLKAIWEDGVDIQGAFAWGLADNWEFGTYAEQFGLQVVDRSTQDRFYKRSFFDIIDFVSQRRERKSCSGHRTQDS